MVYSDDRIPGDVLTVSGTPTFNNKNVGTAKTVTATGISLSGTDSGNYSQNTSTTTTANITARTLNVTATATNKTYDGNNTATVTLADDRVAGDVLTVTKTSATFPDKHQGTGRTVTVSGIAISGTDAANYTQNTSTTTTASISRRALAIGIVASSKTYDATTAASVVFTDNRVSGDTLDITGTPAFADKNVGAGKIVTATGISVTGADAGNYTHGSTSTTTADITRRPLIVTGTAQNKRYDANNTATVDYTDNRVAGDVFTVSGTATFPDEELGTGRPVSVVGITLTGTDAANYSPNTTATSSADIFVRTITVGIDSTVTQNMTASAVENQFFRTSTPLVLLGDLVPATDSRVTFRRAGTADIICDLAAANVTTTTATCLPATLADGVWTYRSSQLINGLMVAASDWRTLTVDTSVPTFTKPLSMGGGTTGNVTKTQTPTIVIPDATNGDLVLVVATQTAPVQSAGVVATGVTAAGVNAEGVSASAATKQCTFTATATVKSCTLPPLGDGPWAVAAQITDPAGNVSPMSSAVTIVIDTVAPNAPAAPSYTGQLSTDPTPTITVTGVSAGDTVTVNGVNTSVAGATSSCAFVAAPGTSSCDMSQMSGGTWSLTATSTDTAGNTSPESAATKLIVSAALAPSAPVIVKGAALSSLVAASPNGSTGSNSANISGAYKGSAISVAVVADLGRPAALINVQTVNFVVMNAKGKVVRRTTIALKPTDTGAAIEIPKSLKGAKVVVYTTNPCGVSDNAALFANVRKGNTSTAVDRSGVPTLDGDAVIPAIEFKASEITLDAADKAALNRVIPTVKDRCGTLLVSGFSRFNTTDSRKYLQNLADFRAQAVAEYLSSKGVSMWIDYRGYIVKAPADTGSLYRRADIRWRPAT